MTTWPRLGAAFAAAALLISGCGAASGSDGGGDGGDDGPVTVRVADTDGAPLYFLKYGTSRASSRTPGWSSTRRLQRRRDGDPAAGQR